MLMEPGHHRFGPAMLLLLATVHLTGCYTWTPTHRPLPDLLEEERPSSIRVAQPGGEAKVVRFPWVLRDTLFSVAHNCRGPEEDWSCDEPAIAVAALSTLDRVEVEELSVVRTVGVVVGGAVFVAGVIVWAAILSECGSDGIALC